VQVVGVVFPVESLARLRQGHQDGSAVRLVGDARHQPELGGLEVVVVVMMVVMASGT
jgi:hypothetical protein